ncbi:MAG: hypothetical protein AB1649_19675 [Chloroflexota bacterium]
MDKPTFYQIKVKGHLDDTLAGWFEGMTISNPEDGDALLSGRVPDQAALQGILNRISNLGLTLISVNSTNEENKDLEQQDKHEADNGESAISE